MTPLDTETIGSTKTDVELTLTEDVSVPPALTPREEEISQALISGNLAAIETELDKGIDLASAETSSTVEPAPSRSAGSRDATTDALSPRAVSDLNTSASPNASGSTTAAARAPTGSGDDIVIGVDFDLDSNARAIGLDNRRTIDTDGGDDLVTGAGVALGLRNAEGFGVLNEAAIRTDDGDDKVLGVATATGLFGQPVDGSALAFGYAEIDPTSDDLDASRLQMNRGRDEVTGLATAKGTDDVGAFGLLFENANTGRDDDRVFGRGEAQGAASTDARGVSVGVSDVDDDTLEEPFVPAAIGSLKTGNGRDTIEGEAEITINAQAGEEVFFAGANGILVDGGSEAQWVDIVTANAQLLADAANEGRQAVREALPALLAQIDTSSLSTGGGNDTLISRVALTADEEGAVIDDDLEVIADAIENAGTMSLGGGSDNVVIELDIRSTIDGAKALGDPLDNSSVGLITGYGAVATQVLRDLGLIGRGVEVEVEVNNSALFDLGSGNDTITSNTFATAVDDLSAGDGLGNRGLWVGGNGRETLDLNTVSVFVLGEVEEGDNEQREGIADGWETRSIVFLDDVVFGPGGEIREGSTKGDGADTVKTDATAFGNGVLTIADGFEGREFTNTGGGNDLFDVTARAFTTEVDRSDPLQVGVLAQNITVATGLQTEQVDEGDFLMRNGRDTVIGRATAAPALGVDGFDFDAADFAPETFDPASNAFANRSTIAQGISQITGDTNATNVRDDDDGQIDTGSSNDTLDGTATAIGTQDVQAYGILLTDAVTGSGADELSGTATATGRNAAKANGIAIGMSNNTDNEGGTLRPDEGGFLTTGDGSDVVVGFGEAITTTDGEAIVSDANADSNGILIDLASGLDLEQGDNVLDGSAIATDDGVGGEASIAVTADGIENRGTMVSGTGADVITGVSEAFSETGVLLTIAGGIDNGFGSTRNNIDAEPTIATGDGADVLEGSGDVTALGGIGLASGIETSGTIETSGGDDILEGTATSTVTDGIRSVADGIENARLVEGGSGGVIDTGAGNDTMIASVTAVGFDTDVEAIAIRNNFEEFGRLIAEGEIFLGDGNDTIEAIAEATVTNGALRAIGILGGSIETGGGDDAITASSNELLVGDNGVALAGGRGLGGDIRIDLGDGNDSLSAFGQATVSGGASTDLLALPFSLADFQAGGGEIVLGDAATNEVSFAFGGETLATDTFENYAFADDEGSPLGYEALTLLAA